jgi:hypothetical protein
LGIEIAAELSLLLVASAAEVAFVVSDTDMVTTSFTSRAFESLNRFA